MRYRDEFQAKTIREAFSALNVDQLKPLAALVGGKATRKGELVDLLAKVLEDQERVRNLYDALDDMSKKSVQEATYDLDGVLNYFQFRAKYGKTPALSSGDNRYGRGKPTMLRLFFPDTTAIPSDLQSLLRGFVPEPPALAVEGHDDLPEHVRNLRLTPHRHHHNEANRVTEIRIRHTTNEALHNIKAVLRLVDLGEVRVGEKTRRPAAGASQLVGAVLAEGDFYPEAEQNQYSWDPASDLRIQAFAWPMLLQAARLAEAAGTRLQLTAAGRKAMAMPAHEFVPQIWERWQKTTLLDEFSRIDVIKGQQAKGRVLTAISTRRDAVALALSECPAQKWIEIPEFFRLLKVSDPEFAVSHNAWNLYIGEQRYGNLGYGGDNSWEVIQGRFVLAFLFEYAATLGLLDVAYVHPEGVRTDYHSLWGTDELSCLSRYDGLVSFRINALGSWCLGLVEQYEPAEVTREARLRVLPNLDVVAADQTIAPADVLLLERYADRKSEAVWQLASGKILEVVGKGSTIGELQQFLEARTDEPLPQTVIVYLDDLANKVSQLEDLGTVRLIRCSDTNLAQLLVHDRRLRKHCQLVGETELIFRPSDETMIRRVLKELGFVLPPPG
jgi:hypothetical protein